MTEIFQLVSEHLPAGAQPQAISDLVEGINSGKRDQVLLGVTGSGKTFTMANIIQKTGRSALIMAHNKTLAAQLFNEMKSFFPHNAVEYFISYYDYYQPEAYVAKTDTYIDKDCAINKTIEIFRHSATRSLMERKDVIVVSSVSSIYGLGTPEYYRQMAFFIEKGLKLNRTTLATNLVNLGYVRNDDFTDNGMFRMRGEIVDIYPPYSEDIAIRLYYNGSDLEEIWEYNVITGSKVRQIEKVFIYPATHYVTPQEILKDVAAKVAIELEERVDQLRFEGKDIEAKRLTQRVEHDMEMMLTTGHFKGIENYSRYMENRAPGSPSSTLFHYLPRDAIVFVDESHVTLPQIQGAHNADRSRKMNLVEHGFRLPSALDNRPMRFEEWDTVRTQTIYVSATPAERELSLVQNHVVEQIIRPTGLVDPIIEVRPLENHFDDLLNEISQMKTKDLRTIVIVLTKKMAEKTHSYLQEVGLKSMYVHADTDTIERIEIINMLRRGDIDVIVGINLLREGIDIPECGLVAVTDADKPGFLRSETALIQIIGRAARNSEGKVIFYGDNITPAMQKAMDETARRRRIQEDYNQKHSITPTTIRKTVDSYFDQFSSSGEKRKTLEPDVIHPQTKQEFDKLDKEIKRTRKQMLTAAKEMNFELAKELRDKLKKLECATLEISVASE